MRTISQIARAIRADWKNVNYAAVPYLDAMAELESITDMYYLDTAKTVVVYFLGNAASWRGPVAKAIKAELKGMIKNG